MRSSAFSTDDGTPAEKSEVLVEGVFERQPMAKSAGAAQHALRGPSPSNYNLITNSVRHARCALALRRMDNKQGPSGKAWP